MSYSFRIDPKDLPPLTPEQQKYPYADLYTREIAVPEQTVLDAFAENHEMDPSKAILPEDLYHILESDFQPEMGYCVLPNGIGYSCTVVQLPGATPEIYDYRLQLVFSEDMGFIVEYPGFHFEHYDGLCIEDNGTGKKALILDRNYSAAELGFPGVPSEINPDILSVSAHDQDIVAAEGPIDPTRGKGVLILVNKRITGGIEQWWFVYSGLHIQDARTVNVLGDNEIITAEECRRKGLHLAYESVNQLQYLPVLMEKYPNRSFSPARPWPERYRFLQHR